MISHFATYMQYMEQFGCVGFCLSMKPNGKLLTASTIKGEEYLMSDNTMTRGFFFFFLHQSKILQ